MAKRSVLPAGYFYRGEVIWCRTDPITGRQVSTGLRDSKGLKSWERKRQADAENPAIVASHAANLGEWKKKIEDQKRVDKSAATVKIYTQKLNPFVAFWGADFALVNITPAACDSYVKHRRLKVSDHTITKEFSALSQMLKAAKRVGCYPHDISTLRPPTVAPRYKPRERHLSWVEVQALLEACNPRLRALVAVSVTTGARLSEALKFDRKDLHQWTAHLRGTKTDGSDRYVPVFPPFQATLTAALPNLPVGKYGKPQRDLARACKRAGIATCTPNDLRRTFASLLVAAGVDKEVVRRLMGHSTSRMVEMVYGRTSPEDLAKLAEPAMPALLLAAPTATINATVIHETKETMQNTGAKSEIRTRDLRFTKPLQEHTETPEVSTKQGVAYPSTHGETRRELGTSATIGATVDPQIDPIGTLRSLVSEFLIWHASDDESGELFTHLISRVGQLAEALGVTGEARAGEPVQ